jgi:hypothetical protein
MVIDDAPLTSLTPEQCAMWTKGRGSVAAPQATRKMDLDCFVMFLPSRAFLATPPGKLQRGECLHRQFGAPSSGVGSAGVDRNWGVLGGEGYVARNERVAEFLARQGTMAISPTEAMSLLESYLCAGTAQAIAIRVDWSKWRQFFRGMQANPLLERIFASLGSEEATGATKDWRSRIDAAPPAEKQAVISQAVREAVGSVLRVKPDSLRDDQPLTDLGLDSLMGVEIEVRSKRRSASPCRRPV